MAEADELLAHADEKVGPFHVGARDAGVVVSDELFLRRVCDVEMRKLHGRKDGWGPCLGRIHHCLLARAGLEVSPHELVELGGGRDFARREGWLPYQRP